VPDRPFCSPVSVVRSFRPGGYKGSNIAQKLRKNMSFEQEIV
jgi:hypothetical protein